MVMERHEGVALGLAFGLVLGWSRAVPAGRRAGWSRADCRLSFPCWPTVLFVGLFVGRLASPSTTC